ncbi:helix-turn-helix domain-containing protein [Paenibacillus lentus]|uniref:AraC family transcriptional regulator n=1 Tax=Paenibacillus lentus TaxID=1338368 RepID=A0A3S8RYT9_9BACL|nr:helix-turn-helix domain-containing protein [Paenibacillus lentus]AZK48068.1 AraC family transcriptional regulator [Paenibacillus lentus]
MKSNRNPNMGILRYNTNKNKFSITRHAPSDSLRFFIQHYWLVDWDLRGQPPYTQEVLQHPGVNVVFQPGNSYICGIESKKSLNILQDKGQIVGILFRPGAFHSYFKASVSTLTDQIVNISDYFSLDINSFEKQLFSLQNQDEKIKFVEQLLQQNMPEHDKTVDLLNEVVDKIIYNADITKVEHLVDQFEISKRTLQRLFQQYIGVSPKWVIRRYRMHEAVELIERGVDITQLAMDLGYFDQAHFSKDFKAAIGKSPKQYAKSSD